MSGLAGLAGLYDGGRGLRGNLLTVDVRFPRADLTAAVGQQDGLLALRLGTLVLDVAALDARHDASLLLDLKHMSVSFRVLQVHSLGLLSQPKRVWITCLVRASRISWFFPINYRQ